MEVSREEDNCTKFYKGRNYREEKGGQIQFPVATTHNTGHTVPDSRESWLAIPCTLEIKTDQQPVKSCNEVWRVTLSIGVGI